MYVSIDMYVGTYIGLSISTLAKSYGERREKVSETLKR